MKNSVLEPKELKDSKLDNRSKSCAGVDEEEQYRFSLLFVVCHLWYKG